MIKVSDLTYSLPEKYLYRSASFEIDDGNHCALIGANGSGKTTLIDILLNGDDYIYSGKVTFGEADRIGYINQFIEQEKDIPDTVFEYLCRDFREMERRLDELCADLSTDEDMDTYQQALDEFMSVDGYGYEVNIHKMLKSAELENIADIPVSQISGGEYKLIQIIRSMLRVPGLLVMDEPDVFLDFENLKSLRDLINSYPGTILVATHNRYILNHCFNEILNIENETIRQFDGTYTDFVFTELQMKIAAKELSMKETDFIAYEETVVDRLRDEAEKYADPAKGRVLRARVSYLERVKARRTKEPYIESRVPDIRFNDPEYGDEAPDYVLKVENYTVAFDELLLSDVSFTVKPGEKVALVGPNGTGKTTLLRDIQKCENGAITLHPDVKVGFLSQFHGETLPENTSVDALTESLGLSKKAAADYLAGYCFEDDILNHHISTLSGGEKNLLQLAVLGCGSYGILLLDEPTSHLDLRSQIALEKAISEYSGAVLMVSHDFYTVSNCVDYVLYAENGTIRRMSGRAFRKMIYKRHFPQQYLELEQKKKELELQINSMIRDADFEAAKALCGRLDAVISSIQSI